MTRKTASAWLFVWLLAGVGAAWAQDRPLNTTEVVQQALERNRDLLAARERVAEAQGLLRLAGVRPAPTVEVDATTGRPLNTYGEEEYSASYFQPIEMGGKRGKRLAVSEVGVSLAEAEVSDRTRLLVFEVKTRIAELLAARRKAAALERLLTATKASYTLTQARVAEGDAAALEARLLATEMSRVEAQRATFAGRSASALLDLRRVAGFSPTDRLVIVDDEPLPTLKLSLDDLKARAATSRPALQTARASEEQAAAELALAWADGVPDLTASATYSHRNSQFDELYGMTALGARALLRDRDNVLSVGLSIPLFAPGRNRGVVDAASARASAARLRREFAETSVPQEVEAAYERWTAARDTLDIFQRGIVTQSVNNLDVVREAYTLGQLRLLDVLNEQRRLLDTELAFIDAQTELAEATADLERAVGVNLP